MLSDLFSERFTFRNIDFDFDDILVGASFGSKLLLIVLKSIRSGRER